MIFLLSGLSTVSAAPIEQISENNDEDSEPNTEIVTLYRYGLDGTISPVSMEIETDKATPLEDNIVDICLRLLEQDEEIQTFIKNYQTDENETVDNETKDLRLVISQGKGFHFKFPVLPPRIKARKHTNRRLLRNPMIQYWHMLLISILRRTFGPNLFIYCRYPRDDAAKTTLAPFKEEETTEIIGPHQVTCLGFIGYTGWMFPRSRSGRLIRQAFAGFSFQTSVTTL